MLVLPAVYQFLVDHVLPLYQEVAPSTDSTVVVLQHVQEALDSLHAVQYRQQKHDVNKMNMQQVTIVRDLTDYLLNTGDCGEPRLLKQVIDTQQRRAEVRTTNYNY